MCCSVIWHGRKTIPSFVRKYYYCCYCYYYYYYCFYYYYYCYYYYYYYSCSYQ